MRSLTIILFILFANLCFAQDRSNYKLLWRISKDNQQLGYLFGTMHVNGERVFDMSDSVLTALDACQQVAFEINFEELEGKLMADLYDETIAKEGEQNSFSEFDFPEYDTAEEEKNDEKINTENNATDSLQVSLKTEIDSVVNVNMKSPLDLYLFKRAKHHGQTILGLENIEEHINNYLNKEQTNIDSLINNEKKRSDFMKYMFSEKPMTLDNMKRLYYSGDIDSLHLLFYKNKKQYSSLASTMAKRNVVMANSIDELFKNGTLFSAIGAAHLSGDDGVIQLLKNKGYTLEPVEATFTGVASNLLKEELKIKTSWKKFSIPDGGLSADLPVQPSETGRESYGFPMYIATDLNNLRFYILCELPMAGAGKNKTVLEEMAYNMIAHMPGSTVDHKEILPYDGGQAMEIGISIPQASYRYRLYAIGDMIYMTAGGSQPGENLYHEDFQHFFDSVKINPTVTANDASGDLSDQEIVWNSFTSDQGAYKVDCIGDPIEKDEKTYIDDKQFLKNRTVNLCLSKSVGQVIFSQITLPNGLGYNSIADLEVMFEDYVNLKNQGLAEVDITDINIDGLPAKRMYCISDNSISAIIVGLRGNSAFLFEGRFTEKTRPHFERVYNSLEWLPLTNLQTIRYTVIDKTASFKAFNYPTKQEEAIPYWNSLLPVTSMVTYSSNDVKTLSTLNFNIYTVDSLYYHFNTDSLLHDVSMSFPMEADSMISISNDIENNSSTIYFIDSKRNVEYHTRSLFRGDKLFQYELITPLGFGNDSVVNALLNSVNITYTSDFNLNENKLDNVLSRIAQDTTASYGVADIALERSVFAAADSTVLINAWMNDYGNDSLFYGSTQSLIFKKLLDINPTGLINTIRKKYGRTTSEAVKYNILSDLVTKYDDQHWNLFKELYPQNEIPLEYYNMPFPAWTDTTFYTTKLDELLEFSFSHQFLADEMLIFWNSAAYSEQYDHNLIQQRAYDFFMLADLALNAPDNSTIADINYAIANLSMYLETNETTLNLLKVIESRSESFDAVQIAKAMYHHKMTLSKKFEKNIYAGYYAFDLMDYLCIEGKSDFIPKSHRNQNAIDLAFVKYYMLDEEYENPELKVKHNKTIEKNFNNSNYIFNCYSVSWDGFEYEDYVVGPHIEGQPLTTDLNDYIFSAWSVGPVDGDYENFNPKDVSLDKIIDYALRNIKK